MTGARPNIDVQGVARLARLRISHDDIGGLQQDLERILAYVQRLEELNVDGVAPMPRPGDETNRLRHDHVGPSLTAEAVAQNAPALRDGELVVPPVLGDAGVS